MTPSLFLLWTVSASMFVLQQGPALIRVHPGDWDALWPKERGAAIRKPPLGLEPQAPRESIVSHCCGRFSVVLFTTISCPAMRVASTHPRTEWQLLAAMTASSFSCRAAGVDD